MTLIVESVSNYNEVRMHAAACLTPPLLSWLTDTFSPPVWSSCLPWRRRTQQKTGRQRDKLAFIPPHTSLADSMSERQGRPASRARDPSPLTAATLRGRCPVPKSTLLLFERAKHFHGQPRARCLWWMAAGNSHAHRKTNEQIPPLHQWRVWRWRQM